MGLMITALAGLLCLGLALAVLGAVGFAAYKMLGRSRGKTSYGSGGGGGVEALITRLLSGRRGGHPGGFPRRGSSSGQWRKLVSNPACFR